MISYVLPTKDRPESLAGTSDRRHEVILLKGKQRETIIAAIEIAKCLRYLHLPLVTETSDMPDPAWQRRPV